MQYAHVPSTVPERKALSVAEEQGVKIRPKRGYNVSRVWEVKVKRYQRSWKLYRKHQYKV